MKTFNLKLLMTAIVCLGLIGCGDKVTKSVTNVQQPDTTQNPHSRGQAEESDSGGVINGGGGKGVLCEADGRTTVEVLDLYEAKHLFNLNIQDLGSTKEQSLAKLSEVMANHFIDPFIYTAEGYMNALNETSIKHSFEIMQFLKEGQTLKLTKDSFEPILEKNCRMVQIAVYYDESALLVDKSLWEQLDWTNKAALVAHEILYFWSREFGATNSMSVRKLVGLLLSTKGVDPLANDLPDEEDALSCRLSREDFSAARMYLFESVNQQNGASLSASFFNLNQGNILFKTTSEFWGLSFTHLKDPSFGGFRESFLAVDSYPIRESAKISFSGISDGLLHGSLEVMGNHSSKVKDSLSFSCDLPESFGEEFLKKLTSESFRSEMSSDNYDELTIREDGYLTLEQTRHVGGPGGITGIGVVPLNTTCRYIEKGVVIDRDPRRIEYQVSSVELVSTIDGDQANCEKYVESFNRLSSDGSMNFSITMDSYKKLDEAK